MDYDDLFKRVSNWMIPRTEEPLYSHEQAAAYLGVSIDTMNTYVYRWPIGKRLEPDFKMKSGRTLLYQYKQSTLDHFKSTIPKRGRKPKVQPE